MKKQSFGLLLSTGPENSNLDAAIGLSEAALQSGKDVYMYLIDAGVLTVEDPRFSAGLKLFACAYGAQQHGVPRKDDRATYCGLVVLSNIISSCDRFVALN